MHTCMMILVCMHACVCVRTTAAQRRHYAVINCRQQSCSDGCYSLKRLRVQHCDIASSENGGASLSERAIYTLQYAECGKWRDGGDVARLQLTYTVQSGGRAAPTYIDTNSNQSHGRATSRREDGRPSFLPSVLLSTFCWVSLDTFMRLYIWTIELDREDRCWSRVPLSLTKWQACVVYLMKYERQG